jgi:lysophospholipase L1-like esterase
MRTPSRVAALIGVAALALAAASCSSSGGDDSAASNRSASSARPSESSEATLSLVAIGDSVAYNSSDDCPGCTGFVDRYAEALAKATGKKVTTSNLSQHNGLTLPMLMDELESAFKVPLSNADAIIVGIAHNSNLLSTGTPCGTTWDEEASSYKDWTKITPQCSKSWVADYRPQYDELFATVASWRDGRPTVLRTVNKYNDWIGYEDGHFTPDQVRRIVFVHDDWNRMLCDSAEAHGFSCADIYHGFNGPQGTTPSGDLLAADYTHPSDQGNARIADILIAQGFGPLA